ncbi:hypothetical protein CC78DRAFT_527912 [Lojkania enalia]|uniref:Secreted protein n=1 Tax=Lojkania enalia TaxID=147567 RepID=A0A9P4ND81_9PLEO|nr:hypothetical protein CC78DRAFT_527912 [Didymosphaeria enalia]
MGNTLCSVLSSLVAFLCSMVRRSSLALKVPRARKDSDALVHSPFADPKVVIDPFLEAWSLCEFLWIYAGAVRSPGGERGKVSANIPCVKEWECMTGVERRGMKVLHGRGRREQEEEFVLGFYSRVGGREDRTYVRPVERRTPARKADISTASKA